MSFFKELWFMVKALFKSKPSEKDFVEIKQMEHFPFKGYLAMSWCGYLLTRYSPDNIDNETVNHETIHLMQAKDEGSWLKFYLKYLWEWIKGGAFFVSSSYYTMKYEVEAYAKEDDETYLFRRKKGGVEKFKMNDRRKTFKECGSSYWFKVYIKNLFKDI